jgi:hypothetical protein
MPALIASGRAGQASMMPCRSGPMCAVFVSTAPRICPRIGRNARISQGFRGTSAVLKTAVGESPPGGSNPSPSAFFRLATSRRLRAICRQVGKRQDVGACLLAVVVAAPRCRANFGPFATIRPVKRWFARCLFPDALPANRTRRCNKVARDHSVGLPRIDLHFSVINLSVQGYQPCGSPNC